MTRNRTASSWPHNCRNRLGKKGERIREESEGRQNWVRPAARGRHLRRNARRVRRIYRRYRGLPTPPFFRPVSTISWFRCFSPAGEPPSWFWFSGGGKRFRCGHVLFFFGIAKHWNHYDIRALKFWSPRRFLAPGAKQPQLALFPPLIVLAALPMPHSLTRWLFVRLFHPAFVGHNLQYFIWKAPRW